jgi:hypothetical protein
MSKQDRNEGKSGISDLTVIALVTSFLLPVVGWILGFRARKQIVDSEGKYVGRPFATAAIWIGGILTSGFIAMVLLMSVGGNDDDGFGWMGHHRMHQGWTAYQPLNSNTGADNNFFDGGMMGGPAQDPNSSTNP